jgi:SAM-dependent methyltransferase
VTLHPLAEQFASVADEYERGRPEYAPAVVGVIAAELRVPAGGSVLDLGAGTGKLSRALLAGGYDVVAVEPLASMRQLLAAQIGPERVHEGRAERIPLPDRSVAAVTAGDSFHWFEQPPALAEIKRVLAPAGGLAVLNTVPDWSGASWAHEVGTLIAQARTEHPHFDGPSWQETVRAVGGFGDPREVHVTVTLPASAERIAAHVASMSWIAALPDERRRELSERIGELLASGETPSELPVHYSIGLASLAG